MISKHTIYSSIALSSVSFGLLCAGCEKEEAALAPAPAPGEPAVVIEKPSETKPVDAKTADQGRVAVSKLNAASAIKSVQFLKDYRDKAGQEVTVTGTPGFVSENRFGDQSVVWSSIPVNAADGQTAMSIKSKWRLLEKQCLVMKGKVRQFEDNTGNIYLDLEEYDAPEGLSVEVETTGLKMSELNRPAPAIPQYSVAEAYRQAQSLNFKTIAINGSPEDEKLVNGTYWYSMSGDGVTLSLESRTKLPEVVNWVIGWVQYDTGGGAPLIHVSYTDYAASDSSSQFRTRLPTE